MNTTLAAIVMASATLALAPAYAQTPPTQPTQTPMATHNAEQSSAMAGGSAGSLGTQTKPHRMRPTAAERAARNAASKAKEHTPAAQAGAGGQ
jgi:hypothetical protein